MLLHNTPLLRIYFGDAKDELFPGEYLNLPSDKNLFSIPAFVKLKEVMRIDRLVFLRQVHGMQGVVVRSKNQAKKTRSFSIEGDYLITNAKHVGLGIMTADCLPIVLYDSFNRAVAVVHASWRTSVKNIVLKAVDTMTQEFGTKPEHLRVFFGPSAKVCCYEVNDDMLEHLEDFESIDRVVQRRDEKLFFDLPGFNKLLLEGIGVKSEVFQLGYNMCTVCDHTFYSHRRQSKAAGRQMTVACLQ